jgi:uncharacterized protein (TIGR02598 family)
MKPKILRFRGKIHAFSLVEVVLAVGVVSFALLSVLAMLPIGLTSVQNAEFLQATGNITDQIRGQLPLLSFSGSGSGSIRGLASTINYYTTDGVPTTTTASEYYKAIFKVTSISSSQPVVDANFNSTSSAQNVTVILTYPYPVCNQTNTFSFFVARQTDN